MNHLEKTYIEKNGEKIYGKKLPVIINNNGYYLIHITIFQDGLIDCWGLKSLDEIKREIKTGKLCQTVPDNVPLECSFGTIESSKFIPDKTDQDFIKEIEDIINELNNRVTRRELCKNAFQKYLIDPSKTNLDDLKNKYDDLPSHQKVLFEYIEEKDPLCDFMNNSEVLTFEERKDLLKHYFKIDLSK